MAQRKDLFLSFRELLRVFVVRGSVFVHGPDAGSVQVLDRFEVETVPALLCPLSGECYHEQPDLHRSQAPVSKNPDCSVSPKWSQSQSWPKQACFRQGHIWLPSQLAVPRPQPKLWTRYFNSRDLCTGFLCFPPTLSSSDSRPPWHWRVLWK